MGKTTSTSTSEVEAEAEAETEAEADAEAETEDGQRLHEKSRKINIRGVVDSAYNYLVVLSVTMLSRSNAQLVFTECCKKQCFRAKQSYRHVKNLKYIVFNIFHTVASKGSSCIPPRRAADERR